MSENQTNTYLIAGAIIVAGALIAMGTIFAPQQTNPGNQHDTTSETVELTVAAPNENDHVQGNINAEVVLIEYSDLECPFCKNFHNTLNEVMNIYEGTDSFAWVFRHFPLTSIHPKAVREAHATECAAELGGNDAFWAYTDRVFEITKGNNSLDLDLLPEFAEYIGLDVDKFNTCQESAKYNEAIKGSFEEAINAGGTGTPFNIFVVRDGMSKEVLLGIKEIQSQFPQGSVKISKDQKRVSFSGGLSFDVTVSIIETLLGNIPTAE